MSGKTSTAKNVMKELHFMKALGNCSILKAGKTKVAREVNINTNSTKKLNLVLTGHRALTGLSSAGRARV